jgi:phage-related minor tail protein
VASEYEQNVGGLISEKKRMLESLKEKTEVREEEVRRLNQEIEYLENLYNNYNLGMNYFRRAKGGRKGLRE